MRPVDAGEDHASGGLMKEEHFEAAGNINGCRVPVLALRWMAALDAANS